MAEIVEGIKIPIELDTKKAEEALASFRKKIKSTLKALNALAKESEDSADNSDKETKNEQKQEKSIKKEAKAASGASKEMKAAFGKIAKAIGAIVAVKKIFDKIRNMMDQGSKNLYLYSKITGDAYSQTLDKFASAREALSNALGGLKAVFVQVIAPLVTQFFQKITPIINKVSQLVAELFNLPYYWKASEDVFKMWDNSVDNTRALLGGFDTLSVFGGLAETAAEDKFERVDLDGSKDGIKDVLQNIKDGVIEVRDKIESKVTEVADKIDPSGNLSGILHNGSSTARGLLEAILGEDAYNNLVNGDFSGLKDNIDQFLTDTGLKDLVDIIMKITYWLTEIVDTVVNSNTFKAAMTSLKSTLALFTAPLAARLKIVFTLFEGFGKMIRGEATAEDILKEVAQTFISGFIKPLVQYVVNIIKFWLTLVDEIAVAIYNLLNPFNKIEHTGIYDLTKGLQKWVDDTFGDKKPTSTSSNNSPVPEKNHGRVAYSYDVEAARGGVFTKPTIAKIGEYSGAYHNPEIATPTNLLDERIDLGNKALLASLYQMNGELVSAIQNQALVVNLDGTTIAQSVAKNNSNYYNLTGKSLMR